MCYHKTTQKTTLFALFLILSNSPYQCILILYAWRHDVINVDTVIQIVIGIFVIGGAIVGFFVMQKGQNMKIEQLQKDLDKTKDDLQLAIDDTRRKQSLNTSKQIQSEKDIVAINVKLDHILALLEEIKRNGHA